MIDPHRRHFLRGSLPAQEAAPRAPRPPWAVQPDADFQAGCTRCGDCLRACPRGVLKAGDGGFPQTMFERQGCSLCGDCSRVCSTGAIGPTSGPAFPQRVQVADTCLAQHGVECRICGEHCDTRAIRFVPALGGVAFKETPGRYQVSLAPSEGPAQNGRSGGAQMALDLAACTGCGDCVAPCPVAAISLR